MQRFLLQSWRTAGPRLLWFRAGLLLPLPALLLLPALLIVPLDRPPDY